MTCLFFGFKDKKKMQSRGVTLIEILISLAIVAILGGIIMFSLSDMRARQDVDSSSEAITSLLKEARSRTLSSLDASMYGVYIEENQATLFKGLVYDPGASTNEVQTFTNTVHIAGVSLEGGGNTILFERLTGKTNNFGTMRVELINNTTTARTIIIDATGLIENN